MLDKDVELGNYIDVIMIPIMSIGYMRIKRLLKELWLRMGTKLYNSLKDKIKDGINFITYLPEEIFKERH